MSKKDPRKLAKKRKVELQRRKQRERGVVLPYHGWTYKTDELTPLFLATELGIHDADLASRGTLVDWNVRRALEKAVQRIRQGTLLPNSEERPLEQEGAEPDERLIRQMHCRWHGYFGSGNPYPGRDTMVGILRTLLGSLETRTTHTAQSRGYLEFVGGFIKQAGGRSSVDEILDVAQPRLLEEDVQDEQSWEDDSPDEEDLSPAKVVSVDEIALIAGRAWIREGQPGAREFFLDLIQQRLAEGYLQEVADSCDELMRETTDPVIREQLNTLVARAQAAQ